MTEEFLLKELGRYQIGTWADIMYRNALLYAEEEAFIYGTERLTFAQYNGRVNSLIHALNGLGVRKGDGIGIFSWNCLEYPDVYGAAMKGGFIISPFNPRLLASEIEYLINYSEVSTLFVGPELVETISSLRDRFPRVKHYVALESPVAGMLYYPELLAKGFNRRAGD